MGGVMTAPRTFIECPCCGGEGTIETGNYRIDYHDGSVSYEEVRCRECDGTGSVEEGAVLVDEDDWEEWTGA
jgi:RecJ-like exonuclease